MTRLTLRKPDDWHLHVRDGALLAAVISYTARRFARAVVMPNLKPPITTTAQANAYRARILAALPDPSRLTPLMTLYLTDTTSPSEIRTAVQSGIIIGVKLYPAGATTHSEAGVTQIKRIYPVLETLAETGLALLVHGEVTDPEVDIFDREAVFIERVLAPIHARFPRLKLVLEHITTREAVDFVREAGPEVGATITPQHLLYNRNALFQGGLRPHHYCLPVLKAEPHRQAVLEAATRGEAKFFLGTDSAPHPRHAKESACGCAGIFSAPVALELYAEIFAACNALDRLEAFASLNGPAFYGLSPNPESITLERVDWTVPEALAAGPDTLVPLCAGQRLHWRLTE